MTLWQQACDPLSPSYGTVHWVVDPQGRVTRHFETCTLHGNGPDIQFGTGKSEGWEQAHASLSFLQVRWRSRVPRDRWTWRRSPASARYSALRLPIE